jgi:hypothetical protein
LGEDWKFSGASDILEGLGTLPELGKDETESVTKAWVLVENRLQFLSSWAKMLRETALLLIDRR